MGQTRIISMVLPLLVGAVAFVIAAFGVHHVRKNYKVKSPIEKKSVDEKYLEEKGKETEKS